MATDRLNLNGPRNIAFCSLTLFLPLIRKFFWRISQLAASALFGVKQSHCICINSSLSPFSYIYFRESALWRDTKASRCDCVKWSTHWYRLSYLNIYVARMLYYCICFYFYKLLLFQPKFNIINAILHLK